MIRINERFSVEKRDKFNWVVHEWYEGVSRKTKEITISSHKSYHANFRQATAHILNQYSGECRTVEELTELFNNAVDIVVIHNGKKFPGEKAAARKKAKVNESQEDWVG